MEGDTDGIDTNTVHIAENVLQLELPSFCARWSWGEGIWEATVGPTMYMTHTKQLLLSDIISCAPS